MFSYFKLLFQYWLTVCVTQCESDCYTNWQREWSLH